MRSQVAPGNRCATLPEMQDPHEGADAAPRARVQRCGLSLRGLRRKGSALSATRALTALRERRHLEREGPSDAAGARIAHATSLFLLVVPSATRRDLVVLLRADGGAVKSALHSAHSLAINLSHWFLPIAVGGQHARTAIATGAGSWWMRVQCQARR